MAIQNQNIVVFVCDSCGTELEVEGRTGLSPPMPSGWWTIQPSRPDYDLFCSWRCLGEFGLRMAEEADKRAAERAAAAAANEESQAGAA